jgi:hypothetical protein
MNFFKNHLCGGRKKNNGEMEMTERLRNKVTKFREAELRDKKEED